MRMPLLMIVFVLSLNFSYANYLTPGTGVKYTLDDLVTHSGGIVTFTGGTYYVNDTVLVNTNDTLTMYTDATVKFLLNTYLGVRSNGVLLVDPPNNVTFTANNLADGYLGVRLDTSSGSIIRNLVFEYAVSFRINDCSPVVDSCTFQYNNHLASTSFGNGAIALFRASPLIKNSSFINNKRAAIQGGSNISNAPRIYNNYFFANSTSNANVPQINLGATSASGQDTVKIIGNTIYGGYTMSGGIGFLPIGNVYAIINGNIIRKNRYGITLNGGANINAVISYNVIDTNNIQNDPNLGGSGISFSGGAAGNHQNTIVTGNILRANLWGITILNRARPNLGDLSNADTTDNGKNQFINNTNATTPSIDLYNNTPDNIMAENNYWNTDDPATAEQRIFHQVDDATKGIVDFDPILTSGALPVTLSRFDATLKHKTVQLAWQTLSEENTAHFNIQRSIDGKQFISVSKKYAAGNTAAATNYFYDDPISGVNAPALFYRLQVVDHDGKTFYSNTRIVGMNNGIRFSIAPNPATKYISVGGEGKVHIHIVTISGQLLHSRTVVLPASGLDISMLKPGMYVMMITGEKGITQYERLLVQE